ncbi:S4A8-like protein [Mya arenaria]|uniref:S4A8-like protein n=1 Tax=Mya arenaria TaxID=6604 RepID=A0ABY7EMI1_MYAAR|nr:S4A8-like protein [Mya arenaria]
MSTEQPTIENEYLNAAEAATERVASIIGNDFDCTDLFCQMDMLRPYKNDMVWKEVARWIRYEEAVEEGGERWSKPHVASLMMEALQDLQSILSTFDVTNQWAAEGDISLFMKGKLCSLLTKQHKFQHYEKKKKPGASSNNLQKFFQEAHINKAYDNNDANHLSPDKPGLPRVASTSPDSPSLALGEMNKSFKRKIPPGSQVVNLLVGEVPELPKIIAAFVRLNDACNVGDITEVDLDTKFMFIIIGTKTHLGHCAEMCRCMATLFTDEFFRIVAFRCKSRQDLLAGIQEFNLHLTVLPPGVWDSSTRIEPPDEKPSQEYRKAGTLPKSMSNVSMVDLDKGMNGDIPGEGEGHNDPTLIRTGRIFGGLINDIKRKLPWYLSDYKDALHIQCVASFFFLFLATLTPNVTFGGLLTQATDDYMGTMECILAAAISGVLFALFSGQPLNILGSTGPMLVLEGILFRFCKDQDWDFMPFRVWVGFWTAFFIFLIVAFDLSALVRYITRFTEESFACLIALIFIVEAFKKTIEIEKDVPVHFRPPTDTLGCFCLLGNETGGEAQLNFTTTTTLVTETTTAAVVSSTSFLGNFSNITNVTTVSNVTTTAEPLSAFAQQCMDLGGLLQGPCDQKYVPDAFFFSLVLFFGTYILATALVHFRHSLFFPSIPTKPGRPWFINPISEKNPWWLMLFSAVPALLATILIFMDQQITAVIVNRSENKLKKGSGYHLDMLIVGVLVIILALFGLPWYVAATVTALAHVMSLKKVSETTAPGEKPTFLGVREQRVTALLVGIFSGLAVLFTSVLRYIPMPVLYGVFLYMGVAPLGGMQLIQRLMIIFMPAKYQPDHSFIRNVPLKRVHLFTFIQVVCLAILWVVKSVKSISIAFPLMVLLICFVRKALDKVFTQRELKWLDDILPATFVKKEEAEIQPVDGSKVKITIDSGDDDDEKTARRTVSNPETETDGKTENGLPSRLALESRKSLTFICKTDIDRIKAMTPEVITDRRKSLIYAAERKKSLASMDGDHKKFSPPSHVFGRKLSCEAYSPHFSPLPLFGGNAGHLEDPHNKLNRMLSLPATITDENEADSDSASSKSINSTKN